MEEMSEFSPKHGNNVEASATLWAGVAFEVEL